MLICSIEFDSAIYIPVRPTPALKRKEFRSNQSQVFFERVVLTEIVYFQAKVSSVTEKDTITCALMLISKTFLEYLLQNTSG